MQSYLFKNIFSKSVNLILISFICVLPTVFGQVVGGSKAFTFLQLPQSAHATALGGMVVSHPANDANLGLENPALLRPQFHQVLGLSNNFYYNHTNIINANYFFYNPKLKTTFATGITALKFGQLTQTNINGEVLGTRAAQDYVLQVAASRLYLSNWRYGATIKYAHSNLLDAKSSALLADFGLVHFDTTRQFYFGAVLKNIGSQLTKYNTLVGTEPMPFDFQVGFSKKFAKAPFRIHALAHHLYQWDIRYNNPADLTNTSLFGTDSTLLTKKYIGDNIFRHFNAGLDLVLGKALEINVAYSHLRRSELSFIDKQGLAGFSFGVGLNLKKIRVHYGKSIYHISGGYNQISLQLKMKDLFGLGKNVAHQNWY